MIVRMCKHFSGPYNRSPENNDPLPVKIASAVHEVGRDPDEIHFSTAQTTANGGQFGHEAALLIWRDR